VLSLNRLAAERFLRGDRVYAPPSLVPHDTASHPLPPPPEAPEVVGERRTRKRWATRRGGVPSLAEQSESPLQCPYCGRRSGGRKVKLLPAVRPATIGRAALSRLCSEVDVGWRYCAG